MMTVISEAKITLDELMDFEGWHVDCKLNQCTCSDNDCGCGLNR